MYLLDTNVWVAYLRGKSQSIKKQLAAHSPSSIALCSIVLGELYFGACKSKNPDKNRAAVDALISPYSCLPYEESAAKRFAETREKLETLGTPIGPYDLQIAAIALVQDCIVVTNNVKEFQRVNGLTIEDWQNLP